MESRMINRMWNESNIGEHPLETYKRLKGINQQSLNDLFGDYAMRNVTLGLCHRRSVARTRVETLDGKICSASNVYT
jgi:hypothetical protein